MYFTVKIIYDIISLDFNVKVTPFERDGSNIRGLARIYLEDSFVVNNVLVEGKKGLFVAMPSYKTKQPVQGKQEAKEKDGKWQAAAVGETPFR